MFTILQNYATAVTIVFEVHILLTNLSIIISGDKLINNEKSIKIKYSYFCYLST